MTPLTTARLTARSALALVCILLFCVAGCARTTVTPAGRPPAVKGAEVRLPAPLAAGVQELSAAEALEIARMLSPKRQGMSSWRDMETPLDRSLNFINKRPAGQTAFSFPGLSATWGDLAKAAMTLRALLPSLDTRPELLATSFRWVRLGPDFSFTGYYEPTLNAAKTPTGNLNYPLYRRPADLRDKVPYHTRHAIDRRGALRGKGLEIAYVDETDAYFLQVQGSGRLLFRDGSVTHVLYGGKNNRSYVSLARVMREKGLLPEGGTNMKAIRKYLAAHPEQRAALFDENPSYVFFRQAQYGPVGSMGAVVTPWVSLAVDRRILPQGAVTTVLLPFPDAAGAHTLPFAGLTLPQDSGGAIKGHRIDIFCGAGPEAEHTAGHLDAKGALYLLLPRR